MSSLAPRYALKSLPRYSCTMQQSGHLLPSSPILVHYAAIWTLAPVGATHVLSPRPAGLMASLLPCLDQLTRPRPFHRILPSIDKALLRILRLLPPSALQSRDLAPRQTIVFLRSYGQRQPTQQHLRCCNRCIRLGRLIRLLHPPPAKAPRASATRF